MAPSKKAPDRVVVRNVNAPDHVRTLDGPKFRAMEKAMLKALPKRAPGLTQSEMFAAVKAHLPQDLFPGGAKAEWWAKSVQLDLEARGIVLRDPRAKPLRWRRA